MLYVNPEYSNQKLQNLKNVNGWEEQKKRKLKNLKIIL